MKNRRFLLVNIGIIAICILELITRGAPAVLGYIISNVENHLRNMETYGKSRVASDKIQNYSLEPRQYSSYNFSVNTERG